MKNLNKPWNEVVGEKKRYLVRMQETKETEEELGRFRFGRVLKEDFYDPDSEEGSPLPSENHPEV